ncbi:hypothetical protein OUZ56_027457 [Daphnia magna]|uniref:Uncharacterized protein n=1 Tax=Daphnia magna TaxID=35525 RepID=A0ABQ9ZPU3_9CRUS|nr:hypothetical protein OUZ56_027457 [Daphnia magna]
MRLPSVPIPGREAIKHPMRVDCCPSTRQSSVKLDVNNELYLLFLGRIMSSRLATKDWGRVETV